MASSRSDLARQALASLGQTTTVTDIDTDTTQHAKVVRIFLDRVLEEVAESFTWPWMRRTAALSLVEQFTADTREWEYSYRMPADALRIRHFQNGVSRVTTSTTTVPWLVTADGTGALLYADQEDAIVEYTSRAAALDVTQLPATYVACCALLLAHYAAPGIITNQGFDVADRMLKLYEFRLAGLKASAMNEQASTPWDTDTIASRA